MSSKHTPGPWRATRDTDSRGNHCWRVDAPTVSLLAVLTYPNAGARAEGINDARLIAAAPDLLAALERLIQFEGELHVTPDALDCIGQAAAAIAKATRG